MGGTPQYKLIARDQFDNPIVGYQFKVSLIAENDGVGKINEKVLVNGVEYIMPPTANGETDFVEIPDSIIGTTQADGSVTVTIHYFGQGQLGVDYDLNDSVGPVWHDADGNVFNHRIS